RQSAIRWSISSRRSCAVGRWSRRPARYASSARSWATTPASPAPRWSPAARPPAAPTGAWAVLAESPRDAISLGAAEYTACQHVLAPPQWARDHARQGARLAGRLFEVLRPYHGLGPAEERLLVAAALLHDVGFPTDPANHHKVSARMVRAMLGEPF